MTLLGFLQLLRKRWVSVLLLAVIFVVGALAVTEALPKRYAAEARSFVSITPSAEDPSTVYQSSQFANQRVKSYTLLIDSPEILDAVIEDLGLDTTARRLAKDVTLVNPPDTTILTVQAEDSEPAQAAAIANSVSTHLADMIETLETPPSGGTSPVQVTLTTPATSPNSPVSPNRNINLALGLLIGLAVGVTVAMAREHLDTTVRTTDDVVALTGQLPLAAVPVDPDAKRTGPLALDTTSPLLESFRTLRSNLRFSHVDNPPRTMVVCSALSAEGKSTTAQNLAIALAQSGIKVCLVDGDLRRPTIATNLGIEGAVGLTNVLIDEAELKDALTSWHDGLLHVLPAGTIPADPPTLLGSEHMRSLLVDLRKIFDYVIIDAPPIIHVSDAAVLADAADGALLVIRSGRSRRDQVASSIEVLATAGARLVGTVLTFAPTTGDYGYGVPVLSDHEVRDADAVSTANAIRLVSDDRLRAAAAQRDGRPGPVSEAGAGNDDGDGDEAGPVDDQPAADRAAGADQDDEPEPEPALEADRGEPAPRPDGREARQGPASSAKALVHIPGSHLSNPLHKRRNRRGRGD
ncbi:polysaccharide biosynthesis tyrosine autokinase [Nocardioides sp. GXZ039]|uniref:polysaccharide biosynthesis tyrosine autokinase n=1 Tax=Nocardioides sp. GXZ039 TaxID=3136018 RepID=UPI0030F3E13B